ncbi:MAG: hypothetical protein NT018_10985 [Armatimonadetes bacterium]|nr:hypothetical protein [Armatimonadota bacterium]
MKQNRIGMRAALAVVIILVAVSASNVTAGPLKYKAAGTFVDSAGGQHTWSVNETHALVWDNKPYIPVGCVFVSKYAGGEASEANYKADVSALEELKAKGITDIVLKTGKPISSCDPAAVQKIISFLDNSGFAYGVEFDDGPADPLSGYHISPTDYKLNGPKDDATLVFDWPDVDSALYLIVSKLGGAIIEKGGAIVKGGKVTLNLSRPLGSSDQLIVYPHKKLNAASGGMNDLWTGFGEYRDRMLAFFKNVKFGQGLRFFLEPFTSKMDFTGDMTSFLPDSPGFRLGFEGYLLRKYNHEGGINAAWGTNERFETAEIAARLVPLWSYRQGVYALYDRSSAQTYSVDAASTQYWKDALDYRDMSTQEYMNTIADTLRKNIANVPIVFKNTKFHRLYANPFGMGGYDGLGVEAYGTGEGPALRVGGGAYALAEESAKSEWFIVANTQASNAANSAGYTSEQSMAGSLDTLREVGCKGFFVEGLQSEAGAAQIDWLKNFKEKISPESLANYKPTVVNYPISPNTGGYTKRLAPDAWWLPTLRVGKTSDLGDGLCAYTILGEGCCYLWSNIGPKTLTFKAPATGLPTVDYPSKSAVTAKKRGIFTVDLTDNPVVLRGLDFEMFFPYETAEKKVAQLKELIPVADKAKIGVAQAKAGLENAKAVIGGGQAMIASSIAQRCIDELRSSLGADTWIEGEKATANSFDGIVATPGASGSLALALDTLNNAPIEPYSATYSFDTKENCSYEIWVAGAPPSEGSPASYTVDEVSWAPITAIDGKTEPYAPGLAWYKIGTTNAFAGSHSLRIRIDGKRQQDNRFYFAIDAIVLSPKGFKPNGIMKP